MPPLTILCADDDPVLLSTLASVLRKHGYTVVTGTNATEALALASKGQIDVALLDHSICDKERLCLRDLLRERQPNIKVILHTGNPEIPECLGSVPVLAKPVDPSQIGAKIEKILRGGLGDRRTDEGESTKINE